MNQVLREIEVERLIAMPLHEVDREVGRQVGVINLLGVGDRLAVLGVGRFARTSRPRSGR